MSASALALLLSSSCPQQIEPPLPELQPAAAISEESIPDSWIRLPVTVDLSAAAAAAEAQIPTVIDQWGAWTMVDHDRIGIKYAVRRSPLSLQLNGSSARTNLALAYNAGACVRQKKPWPLKGHVCPQVASCGVGEPARRADVTLISTLAFDQDWKIRSQSSVQTNYPNRCRVTILDYDVTGHIDRALSNALREGAAALDRRIGEVTDMRTKASSLWSVLSTPIRVSPDWCLLLRPNRAAVSEISGNGHNASFSLFLSAKPSLESGSCRAEDAVPLPPLDTGVREEGFTSEISLLLPAAALTEILREGLRGKLVDLAAHQLRIDDVLVRSHVDRTMITLSTATTGTTACTAVNVHLVGRPHYDVSTQTITLEDLDFSIETKSMVIKTLSWILHDTLRTKIAERARWAIGDMLARAEAALETALNRQIAGNVRLQGGDVRLKVERVQSVAGGVEVRATAHATVSLHARLE